jgi:hypothetical protein
MALVQVTAQTADGAKLDNLLARHLENPFLVLALPVSASPAEIERQAQKLLAMLTAGLAEADDYPTPLGRRRRTAELVRAAVSELRDPERRLLHEFWAAGWGRAS